jgi:DNA-binding NarL/FixJ family response regulator
MMPSLDGIEATKRSKEEFPNVAVVVLSGYDEQQFVFDALKAGASGYLLKTAELDEVVSTVKAAAQGGGKLDPGIAARVLKEFQNYSKEEIADGVFQPLTPREKTILQHMGEGLPNKAIAKRLSISERTVTTHIANIYSKIDVHTKAEAAIYAVQRRLT